ncbi:plasmid fertility inhibition factor family protein [Acinetobacter sp. AYS6]|uniref:plasmid fertility inhibition factor family protein n=1 Tax=Acinetobacter sp. AYS6 TaxID=2983297 RepID=UPI0039832D57
MFNSRLNHSQEFQGRKIISFSVFIKEYKRLRELFRLSRQARTHIVPSVSFYKGIRDGVAYWDIETEKNKISVFYTLYGVNVNSKKDNYIVHVDSFLFYKKWLEDTVVSKRNRSTNCLIKEEMHLDEKFYKAANILEKVGCVVPLAKVTITKVYGKERIFFNDGVTRTLWLLFNNAVSFPICVNGKDNAYKLHHFVGIGDAPISCQNLLNSVNDEYEKFLKNRVEIEKFNI